ncbi:MAG: helix-turn-helix domain-containing protein [Pseudomonadota bacterium]
MAESSDDDGDDPPAFGPQLRALRVERRLSQMALALTAEVSQRHLSFLESGRAQPGRAVAARLAAGLGLSPDAANVLMAAAGFAPLFPQRGFGDPEMAPLRSAAEHVLRGHAPYPAILIDDIGDILDANPAFDAALALLGDPETLWRRTHQSADPRAAPPRRNLYRLTLHPEGTAAALLNFDEVVRATLQRLLAGREPSPRLRSLVAEIVAWPGIDPSWARPRWGPPPAPIMAERYQARGRVLSVFAVVTKLSAAPDAAAAGLSVESYFPADAATQAAFETL